MEYASRNSNLADGRRLYPIPLAQPVTFTVIDDYIVINVTAKAESLNSSSYRVAWNFSITNYHDYAITLTSGKARFRFAGKTFSDTMQYGEQEVSLSDVTIAAGDTYYYPGNGLVADKSLTDRDLSQLIVGFMFNNGLRTGVRQFIAPAQPLA